MSSPVTATIWLISTGPRFGASQTEFQVLFSHSYLYFKMENLKLLQRLAVFDVTSRMSLMLVLINSGLDVITGGSVRYYEIMIEINY